MEIYRFCFVLGQFPITSPSPPPPGEGAYIRRGDLTEGLLRYEFGGGEAYFRNFTVLTPKECKCEEFCLQTWWWICSFNVIIHKGHYPSCPKPQFQSEAKCKAIDTHSRANKTHFHKKGFALSPVLKGNFLEIRDGLLPKCRPFLRFYFVLLETLQDRGSAILPQTANRGLQLAVSL